MATWISGQTWSHSNIEPFPTSTWRGWVAWIGSRRNCVIQGWRKLWVLPLSMRMVSRACLTVPNILKVSDEGNPDNAWRLMWEQPVLDGDSVCSLTTATCSSSGLGSIVSVFFDDILVYSNSLSSHVQHLEIIFQTLQQGKFYLKRSKCLFA